MIKERAMDEPHWGLEEAVKRAALYLSDLISTKLKILFNCKFIEKKLIPYENFQKMDRKFFTFALKNHKGESSIQALDPQVIYIFTNRILGGEGIIEVRKFKELFTFSESYFGKFLVEWIVDAFIRNGLPMQLDKIADSPRYYHLFLPDEKIWQFTFEIYMGQQMIGMYYLAFAHQSEAGQPIQVVDEGGIHAQEPA